MSLDGQTNSCFLTVWLLKGKNSTRVDLNVPKTRPSALGKKGRHNGEKRQNVSEFPASMTSDYAGLARTCTKKEQ